MQQLGSCRAPDRGWHHDTDACRVICTLVCLILCLVSDLEPTTKAQFYQWCQEKNTIHNSLPVAGQSPQVESNVCRHRTQSASRGNVQSRCEGSIQSSGDEIGKSQRHTDTQPTPQIFLQLSRRCDLLTRSTAHHTYQKAAMSMQS